MCTKLFSIARLVVVASVLMAGMYNTASAGILYSDPNAYFNMAGASPWALTGDNDYLIPWEVAPLTYNFQNTYSNKMTQVTMYMHQRHGQYSSVGNSLSYDIVYSPYVEGQTSGITGTDDIWGISVDAEAPMNSFYLKSDAISHPSAWYLPPSASHLTLAVTDSFGNIHLQHQLISDDMFFGIILDEGYLTDIKWYFSDGRDDLLLSDQYGVLRSGYMGLWLSVEFGFGDGTVDSAATTPEPATMLMFGLGLAGLPFVRRLRKK